MKRVFWGGVGYAVGITTSVYVQRRVRRAVEHHTPERVRHHVAAKSRQMADQARDMVIDLRDAAAEGVVAMRRREHELRRELDLELGLEPPPPRHRPARISH